MINVIACLKIKPGHLDEFVKIFKANVPNVLAEKGCIEYVPTVDVPTSLSGQIREPDTVVVIEKWASLEDLDAHRVAPHMLAYGAQVKNILESVTLKILAEV